MAGIKRGDRVTLAYEGREFDVIIIDPSGLGKDQPSVGFGFRMAERYVGVPNDTLSRWVLDSGDNKSLKLPSGREFRVLDITANDGNDYSVVEASDWFAIALDVILNPGRTGKGIRAKLGDFLQWFAVKGFYAEAYVAFKGVYTTADSRATTTWLESRQLGVPVRNFYTDLLNSQGCNGYEYGNWTNYVYQGLFDMKKSEMVEVWDLVAGNRNIGRNYIPKAEGLDAVRYCEDMVVRVFVDDLKEAHDIAINLTKRKYLDRS